MCCPLELKSRWYLRAEADDAEVQAACGGAELLEDGAFLTPIITGYQAQSLAERLHAPVKLRVLG